jgi:hypothetical protein
MSNFGVDPNSVALKYDWTSNYDAENIEMAGKVFSNERDFGNGLNGLNGLGRNSRGGRFHNNGGLGNFLTDITDFFSTIYDRLNPRPMDEYEAFDAGGAPQGFGSPNNQILRDIAQHKRNVSASSPMAAAAPISSNAVELALATSSYNPPEWQKNLVVYNPNVNWTQRGYSPGDASNTMTYGALLDQQSKSVLSPPSGPATQDPFDWSAYKGPTPIPLTGLNGLTELAGLGGLGFALPDDFTDTTSTTSQGSLMDIANISFFGLSLPVLALLGIGGYMLFDKGSGLVGNVKSGRRKAAKKRATLKRLEAQMLEAEAA